MEGILLGMLSYYGLRYVTAAIFDLRIYFTATNKYQEIFPAPANNTNQVIPISRRQLFGSCIFPNRNPADTYNLSITNLRRMADGPIRFMGFTPA